MTQSAYILGTGSCVPEKVMTNAELESIVETNDDWITARTGIRERRIAADGETSSTLGTTACKKALASSGISAEQIGMIVVATSTPDMIFPSTACMIQHALGVKGCIAFDISAACAGYIYALDCARKYVESGSVDYALVVGAETMSRIMDWTDRSTCILFGDGAGAAVVGKGESGGLILDVQPGADGSLGNLLTLPGTCSPADAEGLRSGKPCLTMAGREVFKHAVQGMSQAASKIIEDCGRSISEVDCIIPHQANMRIIQAIQKHLGVDRETFYVNLDRYGNTSAASVIIALDEALERGRVNPGSLVLFVVFGGGFTWGAGLVEWSE